VKELDSITSGSDLGRGREVVDREMDGRTIKFNGKVEMTSREDITVRCRR
jgi:hypothetical protein